jgi:IS30 family transposase
MPGVRTADAVRDAIAAALTPMPSAARRTLTWDQGSEMAHHHRLAELFTDGIFFAHPGKPWQRGTNENTNGLLRQYLPKSTDLSLKNDDELREIEIRLNNRPRKRLDWKTPTEVFQEALLAS